MPIERNGTGGSNADLLRRKFEDYLSLMSSGTAQLIREDIRKDNDGNVINISYTKTNVKGDLQFATFKDIQILGEGIVTMGDGIFYCVYSSTLNEFDKILFNGIEWELTKQVEAEELENALVYQAWVCKRRV